MNDIIDVWTISKVVTVNNDFKVRFRRVLDSGEEQVRDETWGLDEDNFDSGGNLKNKTVTNMRREVKTFLDAMNYVAEGKDVTELFDDLNVPHVSKEPITPK